jgi:phosphoesterase RecJ-like protein
MIESAHMAPYRPPMTLEEALGDARRIVLTAHVDPDPDALGCAMGLAHTLRTRGWDTLTVCIGRVPSFAPSLVGFEDLMEFPSRFIPGSEPPSVLVPGDALVVTDTPTASRMAAFFDLHEPILPSCRVVVFDHHITNDLYGDVNFLDPAAAATAEVVCDVLDASGIPIDSASAACFMMALLADTQTFRTENTTARSLRRGYQLAEAGAPIFPVAQMLFKVRPLASVRLWGSAFQRMKASDGVIWTAVTQNMLRDAEATMEDAEGLVDFLLTTREAQVAIVLKEDVRGETKVSMRTVPGVDATKIVDKFGGGGHQRAAGCTILAPPEDAAELLLPLVFDELKATVEVG